MSDSVNKPSHYAFSEIECIDYLRAIVPLRSFIDHCRMSAIAYITRSPHKGSEVEDIDKAINYLQRARNEAEKAIEAAESNCPETPDSSSGKAIPIPHGWRELEPDEMPLATDMHEWMGGWFYRKDDATREYIWHSSRHIRKIETLKPKPLAIPEGWRELEAREMPIASDMYEHEGRWLVREGNSSVEYEWYDVRQIRKIETANPSETSNCSIPDPGPGYRLLSKEPPEPVQEGDEFWCDTYWEESDNWRSIGQQCSQYYRRKIEPTEWIPKVGDKVRVNRLGRLSDGKIGVIAERDAGEYTVRILGHDLTSFNLTADDLELIEAAS